MEAQWTPTSDRAAADAQIAALVESLNGASSSDASQAHAVVEVAWRFEFRRQAGMKGWCFSTCAACSGAGQVLPSGSQPTSRFEALALELDGTAEPTDCGACSGTGYSVARIDPWLFESRPWSNDMGVGAIDYTKPWVVPWTLEGRQRGGTGERPFWEEARDMPVDGRIIDFGTSNVVAEFRSRTRRVVLRMGRETTLSQSGALFSGLSDGYRVVAEIDYSGGVRDAKVVKVHAGRIK
jgi:hypothetical protein